MDISADDYESDVNRRRAIDTVLQVISGLFRKLIGFFEFSKDDRLKAGIYISDERQDG